MMPLGMMPGTRPPFQGDSLGDVFPGLKPMGCSVFALWAMAKCPNSMATGGDARFTMRLEVISGDRYSFLNSVPQRPLREDNGRETPVTSDAKCGAGVPA